jgi:phenylpyruvate tautomerase PptA (4-oxalocrotonate tautomerase family)
MPVIKVQTSVACSPDVKESLVKELSAMTAGAIGKPEMYQAAVLEDDAVISFGGEVGPAAFVEVRSIGGLNRSVNNDLAKKISDCLSERLGIDTARIYLNFFEVPASDWAWKGNTFG